MLTAKTQKLCQCPVCLTLNPISEVFCEQCHAHLVNISPMAIQKTIALLVTSYLLFIPANFLPMMVTTLLGVETKSTVLGGVFLLWGHGSYLVASIVFLASIVIPIAKLFTLSWLCYQINYIGFKSKKIAYRSYQIVELIGKWSMIDVYVVLVLVALVNMGAIINIEAGIATLAFSGFVITSMLAASTFDSRLIWQSEL
jgi:paraquat-inducible protein A